MLQAVVVRKHRAEIYYSTTVLRSVSPVLPCKTTVVPWSLITSYYVSEVMIDRCQRLAAC